MKKYIVAVAGVCALLLSAPSWAGDRTVDLKVGGMMCAMCAPAAEKALKKVEGVKGCEIQGDQASVVVEENVKDTDLVQAIEGAGFTATVVSTATVVN